MTRTQFLCLRLCPHIWVCIKDTNGDAPDKWTSFVFCPNNGVTRIIRFQRQTYTSLLVGCGGSLVMSGVRTRSRVSLKRSYSPVGSLHATVRVVVVEETRFGVTGCGGAASRFHCRQTSTKQQSWHFPHKEVGFRMRKRSVLVWTEMETVSLVSVPLTVTTVNVYNLPDVRSF